MSHLLGIDLGTSSVKALLATDEGRVLSWASTSYAIYHPRPGWAEQDPHEWWDATINAVRLALERVEHEALSISAIGLSGQMHGTVLLRRDGQVLSPAVIWPDQRSGRQVREIAESIGAERLIEVAGSPVATGFQAATVRWVQEEQPELWRRTDRILSPKDYVRWRLTGEYCTDPSEGSGTLLLDVHHRDWSSELLGALGIERAQLSPVLPSTAVAGQLSKGAARAMGLPVGVPVGVGAADTASSALGAGITGGERLLLTISTGGQLVLPVGDVLIDRQGRIHTFCAALAPAEGQAGWYQMAAILAAGMALRWLRDCVLGLEDEDSYVRMVTWAERVPPGANGLLFLPYLAGERTPHMDPHARGAFIGLTTSHARAELVRAVLEGVALACYDAFQVIEELGARPTRIVMAGGGARSQLWKQIVADVFGLPVQGLDAADQSAMGAALLAGGSVGLFDPAEIAQTRASYGTLARPDEKRHGLYSDLWAMFREAYSKHRDDFRRLEALRL